MKTKKNDSMTFSHSTPFTMYHSVYYPVYDYYTEKWRDMEYRYLNEELQDIAWKLYDLTSDFKDLQASAMTSPRNKCTKGENFKSQALRREHHSNSSSLSSYKNNHPAPNTHSSVHPRYRHMTTDESKAELRYRLAKEKTNELKHKFDSKKYGKLIDNGDSCSICYKSDYYVKPRENFNLSCDKTYVLDSNDCKIVIYPK